MTVNFYEYFYKQPTWCVKRTLHIIDVRLSKSEYKRGHLLFYGGDRSGTGYLPVPRFHDGCRDRSCANKENDTGGMNIPSDAGDFAKVR